MSIFSRIFPSPEEGLQKNFGGRWFPRENEDLHGVTYDLGRDAKSDVRTYSSLSDAGISKIETSLWTKIRNSIAKIFN